MTSNGHGGARRGAGRRKGSLTKRTREIAEKALAEGITPLEMMLKAMRALDAEGQIEKAGDMASKAAPYMHARLSSVEMTGDLVVNKVSAEPLTDDEWAIRHTAYEGCVAPAGGAAEGSR